MAEAKSSKPRQSTFEFAKESPKRLPNDLVEGDTVGVLWARAAENGRIEQFYKEGTVVGTKKSADGKLRAADLMFPSGGRMSLSGTQLRQPISCLLRGAEDGR